MRQNLTTYLKTMDGFLGSALDRDGVNYRVIVGSTGVVQWMYARLFSDDVNQWAEMKLFLEEHPLFPAACGASLGDAINRVERKVQLLADFNSQRVAVRLWKQRFPLSLWSRVVIDLAEALSVRPGNFYETARDTASAKRFPSLYSLMQFEKQHPELTEAASFIDQNPSSAEIRRAAAASGNVIPFPVKARG